MFNLLIFIIITVSEMNMYNKIKKQYDELLNPLLELAVAMLLMLRKNQEFVGEFALFLDKHSEVRPERCLQISLL